MASDGGKGRTAQGVQLAVITLSRQNLDYMQYKPHKYMRTPVTNIIPYTAMFPNLYLTSYAKSHPYVGSL